MCAPPHKLVSDTQCDTVTPDQHARAEVEEAAFVCAEHACRVHHFDNGDFEAVFLVNNTDIVDALRPTPQTMTLLRLRIKMSLTLTISMMHQPALSRFKIQTMTSCVCHLRLARCQDHQEDLQERCSARQDASWNHSQEASPVSSSGSQCETL